VSPNPEIKRQLELYTVGHSNYALADFVALLAAHAIEVIADVRSHPYSKYAKHFHGPLLAQLLAREGIKYVFLGELLGGKPAGQEFYDSNGQVDYTKLAASPGFKEGMARLESGLEKYRVAVMCGEEDPCFCHRHLLIARQAALRGVAVRHIRRGGKIQDYEEFVAVHAPQSGTGQLSLFSLAENPDKGEQDGQS
jgi:uncharacterized protein (DUF488 family)